MKAYLIAIMFLALFILGCGHEEGTVRYEDCREIIYLEKNSWQLYLHSFVCTYNRNIKGEIISGTCVRVEMDDSIFSHSGICKKAYIYYLWK